MQPPISCRTTCDRTHYEQTDINYGSIYFCLSSYDRLSSIFVETGLNMGTYIQPSANRAYTIQKRNRCKFNDHFTPVTCSNQCEISESYLSTYLQKQNLGLAASTLNINEMEHIINLGIIDINKRSDYHRYGYSSGEKPTALYLALHGRGDQRMKFPAFKLLVDAGADINQTVYSCSLISNAAFMVRNDWNGSRASGRPLETASSEMEILKLLICKGATGIPKNEAVNEAISQLFNKYKQLLIAAKDDQSPLNYFPREILSYISILSTRVTYDNETPKKKVEEVSEKAEKKIEETSEKSEQNGHP